MKLDQAEFLDMGSLSRDSAFNVSDWGVRKNFSRLCDWLVGSLKYGPKDGLWSLTWKCQTSFSLM